MPVVVLPGLPLAVALAAGYQLVTVAGFVVAGFVVDCRVAVTVVGFEDAATVGGFVVVAVADVAAGLAGCADEKLNAAVHVHRAADH